jgi:hypothetical protein
MPATTNFLQWNPTASNQESDSSYASDAQRTGGASSGEFPSATANKLFFQCSTFVAALGQMLATKGYSTSDADISVLAAVLANLITNADLARLSIQATRTNMIGSYAAGSTYTNTSGKAVFEEVTITGPFWNGTGTDNFLTSIINGVAGPANCTPNATNGYASVSFWVPAGGTFSVSISHDGGFLPVTLTGWTEVSFGL